MSDEINHRRSHILETAAISIAGADPSPLSPADAFSPSKVEVRLTFNEDRSRVLKTDNNVYPAAVLAELSLLVRDVRVTSPDSALATIADAKIGRSIAHGGNDNILAQQVSGGRK
jgi:hypothetical protein